VCYQRYGRGSRRVRRGASHLVAGGTITGKVTMRARRAKGIFILEVPNPSFVQEPTQGIDRWDKRLLKQIEVNKDGGLKNAVVAVIDVEDKAFVDGYQGTDVVAEFCEFLPSAVSWSTPRTSTSKS